MSNQRTDLVQGTLDMLILKTLALETMHGYGISLRIEQISGGVFQVNPGSLLPALSRLERQGLVSARWQSSENNRRAKYYDLTDKGRAQFKSEKRSWERQTNAIAKILEA
jgi:transcriptional regulator